MSRSVMRPKLVEMRPEPVKGNISPSVGIEVVGLTQPLAKLIINFVSAP
jgi:hypothetical protein